jgi:hypothetical protein
MRRTIPVLAVVTVVLLMAGQSSFAITGGAPDSANVYSNIGAMVFLDPSGIYEGVCSGTLLTAGSESTPAQFLTAGHCTMFLAAFGIQAEDVFVTFDPKITPTGEFAPTGLGYVDAAGLALIPATTYATHPGYKGPGGSLPVNDVGVITLAGPIDDYFSGLQPVTLAPVGFLDQLDVHGQSVLGVGYGFQAFSPSGGFEWTGWRTFAPARVSAVQPSFLHTAQNPNATGQGGFCSGDSGGPQLFQGVEVAIMTWGAARCEAQGMAQRLDLATVQEWLSQFMEGD